jgi:hypothetical protein
VLKEKEEALLSNEEGKDKQSMNELKSGYHSVASEYLNSSNHANQKNDQINAAKGKIT